MNTPPVSENIGWIPTFYSREVGVLTKNQPNQRERNRLVKISVLIHSDGSNPQKIVNEAGEFSWTPDGKSLLYALDCKIYKIEIGQNLVQELALPEGYCYWYAALQPGNE
jgi:predicted RNA-binding protein